MKEIKIKTPYGVKNWSFVKQCFDNYEKLLQTCQDASAILEKANEESDEDIFMRCAEANTILYQAINNTKG